MFPEYDQTDTYVLKWNPDKFGYPKYLHIWAAGDWDIPSKLRFDAIYPWVVILASRQFRAAYWLITTKTWVVGGTLLTQSSSFSTTGKLCSTHFICGNLVLSQRLTDPILTDAVSLQFRAAYWLITTKLIHMSLSEILTSLVIRKLITTFKTPSVAILASRQFRVAYWLITTKTSVVCGTPVTLSFRFLNEREIMYHSPYMWKSCSHPTPYRPRIYWRGVTSIHGGILAEYDQIASHVLKWNPANLVNLSFFTYELRVIGIFLQNSVLMLYIRRWPSWRRVSSCLRNNAVFELSSVHKGYADKIETQTHTACRRRELR